MSGRSVAKSAFQNLRPTIMREPARSSISAAAEAQLLDQSAPQQDIHTDIQPAVPTNQHAPTHTDRHKAIQLAVQAPGHTGVQPVFLEERPAATAQAAPPLPLLLKKKRERLLLVSFRMPQSLKEKLELAAKTHEINQTDIINEAIEINLQRYL